MNKEVRVYSHPRSGTNFLIQALKINFYPDVDFSVPGGKWGHWSDRKDIEEAHGAIEFARMAGGHRIPRKLKYPAIYIIRDGRSVALSVWKSEGFLNSTMNSMEFSEYLRTNLDWKYTPAIKVKPYQTILEHWIEHVIAWENLQKIHPNLITFVKYENLVLDFDRTMLKIQERLGLELKQPKIIYPREQVGPSPNFKNHIDKYKEFFSKEDLLFFEETIKKARNVKKI